MSVSLIVAADEDGGIGYEGQLPWPYLKDDLKHFSETTDGSIVVMGRKTWQSIPARSRPLSGRLNLVLTHNGQYHDLGMVTSDKPNYFATFEGVMTYSVQQGGLYNRDIFIIGGASLYGEALEKHVVTRIYLTRVHEHYKADTFFPTYWLSGWDRIYEDKIESTEKTPAYTFYEYVRKE